MPQVYSSHSYIIHIELSRSFQELDSEGKPGRISLMATMMSCLA